MIGSDRVQFLTKELKDIANKDKNAARPVFMLAYIFYNTGDERLAAGYLDLADKRSGGKDPFYKLVRSHWVLPSGEEAPSDAAAPELNK